MAYFFIDVILPRPLHQTFTYQVSQAEYEFIQNGMRVAVPFGKNDNIMHTAIVLGKHQNPPERYVAKEIHQIMDEKPLVTQQQLALWQWISSYYLSPIGDIMRAALPIAFVLESETLIRKKTTKAIAELDINDNEYLVLEALEQQENLKIKDLVKLLSRKNVLPIIKKLLDKELIETQEELFAQYKPKLIKYVSLNNEYKTDEGLQLLVEKLSRANKQRDLVLSFFTLKGKEDTVTAKALLKKAGSSAAILKALVDKGVFMLHYEQEDRVLFSGGNEKPKALTQEQEKAYQEINTVFETKDVCLLHGVTSSGKTEIYVKAIEKQLQQGKQSLYLLPEIALTTQLIGRLKKYFGNKIVVYHSKYSIHERVEVWNNVLNKSPNAQIIIGARSAIFLPFQDLGLVIIDEEHEVSFKQFDPSPRYHARDTAIVLAKKHHAKVLLGSATPAIETYHNAKLGKYGLVELFSRFGDVKLPQITLVDLKEKYFKKQMKGHYSDTLLAEMNRVLSKGEQLILFQNRRGYAPVLTCHTCGESPQCPNCDVSLTYHKYHNQLRCHYCSYNMAMPLSCPSCSSSQLSTKGFGTEQVELEIQELFPNYKVGRMDFDTTKGKYGYQKIINAFQAQEIDILVGTQMLSKGLDFSNVSLVGVLNADNLLFFPDFRAHEHSFQLLTQVSGRAGRNKTQGKVIIQTYNPEHNTLKQVIANDYLACYNTELIERKQFQYPPFFRLIRITLKHKDYDRVDEAAVWLSKALRQTFGNQVLGPETPAVGRIRNLYIRNILLKIPPKQSLVKTKAALLKIQMHFEAVPSYRAVRLVFDVDAY
jgi:primosomal protein N' (replication factor Y)